MSEAPSVTETRTPQLSLDLGEPISPELALVDPELARRARALLPDIQPPTRAAPAYVARLPPTAGDVEAPPARRARRATRGPRRLVVLFALLLLSLVAGAVPVAPVRSTSADGAAAVGADARTSGSPRALTVGVDRARTAATPRPPLPAAASTTPRASGSALRTAPTRQSPPVAPRTSAPGPVRTTKEPLPSVTPPPATRQPVPAKPAAPSPRVFVWLPAAGASHYRVEFFRNTERIFVGFPTQPRVVVPGRWTYEGRAYTLAPGNYRWIVRPGVGTRERGSYGDPVVSSALVVPS